MSLFVSFNYTDLKERDDHGVRHSIVYIFLYQVEQQKTKLIHYTTLTLLARNTQSKQTRQRQLHQQGGREGKTSDGTSMTRRPDKLQNDGNKTCNYYARNRTQNISTQKRPSKLLP